MKNKYNMTTLFLATALALSCGTKDIIPVSVTTEYSIIDGDTIKTRIEKHYRKILKKAPLSGANIIVGDTVLTYQEIKLHTPPVKIPDLSKLKNNDDPELKGKPLRYIAVGGSITAGFRDGGYFNEGILTSYPNLIARQMRLDKFEQPLFESTDYNGTGRIVATKENMNGGPVQKFKMALNNNGVESADDKKVTFKPNKKTNLDNYGIPFLQSPGYGWLGDYSSYQEDKQNDIYTSLFKRVIPTGGNFRDLILKQNFDFVTVEFNQVEAMLHDLGGPSLIGRVSKESKIFEEKPYEETKHGMDWDVSAQLYLIRRLEEKGVKNVVLLNKPNYLKFPYFTQISLEMIAKGFVTGGSINIDGTYGYNYFTPSTDILLPSSTVDSLLSPRVHITLKKGVKGNTPLPYRGNMIGEGKVSDCCSDINTEIELMGKRFNYPVVDLEGLYEKILKGNYMSSDGLRITTKEFFSIDGIHPTALGQACIANEVIQTINAFYKTNIEIIPLRGYMKK